jgi:hypothetical protein
MPTPTSPKAIQQLIDDALENQQSLVQWLGQGGLENVLSAINQNTIYRGIMPFPNTGSMALAGGGDSQYAVCLNDGVGLNFYKYFSNIDETVFGGITSSQGGQWRPIYASQNTLTGVWKEGATNSDIIPSEGFEDSAVAIGKTSASVGLWMDFASTDSLGEARGVRLPVLSTLQINAKTLVDNEMFYNSNDQMLLRYDPVTGNTKSASVYKGSVVTSVLSGATSYTVSFASSQHVNTYMAIIVPTNEETGSLLIGGYYISGKTNSQFVVNFLNPPVTDIIFSIDFQLSH